MPEVGFLGSLFLFFFLGVPSLSVFLRGGLGRVDKVFISFCERTSSVFGKFRFHIIIIIICLQVHCFAL